MARPAPARPARAFPLWTGAGFAALLVWSWHGTGVDPAALFGREGLGQIAVYVQKLFPPDLSMKTVTGAGIGAVETFAISFLGSLLAVLIALPLAAPRRPMGSAVRPRSDRSKWSVE